MKKRAVPLSLEPLEDRNLLATFGVPWPDAAHLKMSFVPDGTQVGTARSVLFQDLNAVASTGDWQRHILRAVQAWAGRANINVGLMADGGQPLGTPGAIEGDTRF